MDWHGFSTLLFARHSIFIIILGINDFNIDHELFLIIFWFFLKKLEYLEIKLIN